MMTMSSIILGIRFSAATRLHFMQCPYSSMLLEAIDSGAEYHLRWHGLVTLCKDPHINIRTPKYLFIADREASFSSQKDYDTAADTMSEDLTA